MAEPWGEFARLVFTIQVRTGYPMQPVYYPGERGLGMTMSDEIKAKPTIIEHA